MRGGPVKRAPTVRGPVINSSLIIACQSTQALVFGGVALFLPLIRDDLRLSYTDAGTLAAAGTFTYALMQVPSGYLADRFDPKRVFIIGLAGVNVLTLSFTLLQSYALLIANQALSGIFRSLVFAPGLLLIARQFRPDRRATAMGLYVAGGFSSNVLLNALGPWLVEPLGWRGLFVLFAISGLVLIGAFAALGTSAPHPVGTTPPTYSDLRRIVVQRVVWLTGLIQFVRLAVVTGVAFWLPSLIVEDKGFSLGAAGAMVALGALLSAPSNFLGGWLSDRLQQPLAVISLSLTLLAITLPLISVLDDLTTLMTAIAVNSIVIQLYFGPLFAVALQRTDSDKPGLVTGFGNFCANLGGFASSLMLGLIKEATDSFDLGLWILSGLCALGLGATWLVSQLPGPPIRQALVPRPSRT